MKRLLLVAIAFATLSTLHAAPPGDRAHDIIRILNLKPLPRESGYLGIIGVSAQKVTVDGHKLAVQSQNYYMLTRDKPINYLHWLADDDTHILVEGGPVDYFIFHPDGRAEQVTLGLDLVAGQRPVTAVPGNCWKALRLRPNSPPTASKSEPALTSSAAMPAKPLGPPTIPCAPSSAPTGSPEARHSLGGMLHLIPVFRGQGTAAHPFAYPSIREMRGKACARPAVSIGHKRVAGRCARC
jgi:hypothetical protein